MLLTFDNRPGGEVKQAEAGFDYSYFESSMSKFDTTFQVRTHNDRFPV